MQFVSVREFRNSSKAIWAKLKSDGEVVITNNGQPTAILVNVEEGDFEETLTDVRRAKAIRDFSRMREEAEERGFLSDEEINAGIQAYRKEKHASAQ
jgi:PHD/YefM family antitoxin component YafN of YafNO toxin-antitoxin module